MNLELIRIPLLALALLAPATLAADSPRITLNFQETDIREVATSIGEITGKNFILDPRVKGKVTVVSAKPIPIDAVYSVFLSVLQVNGFTAVPAGEMTKVIPTVDGRTAGGQMITDGATPPEDEIVTEAIELRNVAAQQMVGALRPLIAQYGHLASAGSNVLIVSDTGANIVRLKKLIERIDRSTDADVEVVTLQNATAGDVVRVVTSLLQAQTKELQAAPPTLVADERTNSVIVSGSQVARLRTRALIAHLDTPTEQAGNTRVVYLKYASAEPLATILKGYVQERPQAQGATSSTPSPDGKASIIADASTNALVITAPPKTMKALESVIERLDIRRAQVLVEAIIVEVAHDRSAELGVTWMADARDDGAVGLTNFSGSGTGIASVVAGAQSGQVPTTVPDGLTFGVGRLGGGTEFAALIRALAGDSTTNILSTPSLLTMDNEEAEIKVGQEVPFLTGSYSGTGGSNTPTNPFQTIQRKEVGINLKVTPQINQGNAVMLKIGQEVSSISQGSQGAVDLITNKRTISTNVVVENGETIVLGGLIDDNLLESEQRVPLLGSIPGLGALFRYRTTTKVKRNLMVFLRPSIIRTSDEATFYTDAKYRDIRELTDRYRGKGVQLIPGAERPRLPSSMRIDAPPTAAGATTVEPASANASSDPLKPGADQEPAAAPPTAPRPAAAPGTVPAPTTAPPTGGPR